jgi:hypothetical protein
VLGKNLGGPFNPVIEVLFQQAVAASQPVARGAEVVGRFSGVREATEDALLLGSRPAIQFLSFPRTQDFDNPFQFEVLWQPYNNKVRD